VVIFLIIYDPWFIPWLKKLVKKMVEASKVDKMGRTTIPSKIRKFLGIKDGDTIEWIIRGDSVIVRKSIQGIGNVRDRFNRLRKRAPECFVYDEKLEESELVKGLERWALAKLGLME